MVEVLSLHSDNAQHYIKDFFIHLIEGTENSPNFNISDIKNTQSLVDDTKKLYEDIKSFYANKKSHLFIIKDDNNAYQGHFILRFNNAGEDEISNNIELQQFSEQDGFGLDETDEKGYLSLSKMSIKNSEKDIFTECYIEVFKQLDSLKAPQLVINSQKNETFERLCDICDGQKIENNNGINYVIPVNLERINQVLKGDDSADNCPENIGALLEAIKQTLVQKQQEKINPYSISSQGAKNLSSAIDRLNRFREIAKK